MKTTDKTLQRKTIELTTDETQKAILYYLEHADYNYEKASEDGQTETVKSSMMFIGEERTVSFDRDSTGQTKATVIAHT